MHISRKNLDPITLKKGALIDELWQLVHEESDVQNAFFDVKINGEQPQKSRILANRPGVELFATELMKEMENHYDETSDALYEVPPISVGSWCKKSAKIRFTELEVKNFDNYRNTYTHNETRAFWSGLISSIYVYFQIAVYVLALFGAVAVYKYIIS